MTILFIILGIAAVIGFFLWTIYNRLVRAQNVVDEAFSGIDVQLKKRFTLIPQLVDVTKAYNKHESNMLERIVKLRSGASLQETADNDQKVTSTLNLLKITVEDYPELKANTQFLKLMDNLSAVENDLSMARRYYNGATRDYNTKIEVFPAVLIAGKFGFKEVDFYEINEDEKAVPEINLND
ncbi:MAG: LemA family protein [Fluviicola sp.]|nr:LemA family protein [Fluviicola sp.]